MTIRYLVINILRTSERHFEWFIWLNRKKWEWRKIVETGVNPS